MSSPNTRVLRALPVLLSFGIAGCLFVPEASLNTPPPRLPAGQTQYTIEQAQVYADTVEGEINSLDVQASALKTSTNLAALGTGAAGVAAAAFKASRDLILGLGIGSAGALSLQYASAVNSKQTILDNARLAIGCAERTAQLMARQTPSTGEMATRDVEDGLAYHPSIRSLQDFRDAVGSARASTRTLAAGAAAIEASDIATNIADDAVSSQQAAMDSVTSELVAASQTAPQFLVNTVEQIEGVLIKMLHSSEPSGEDILSDTKTATQSAVQGVQTAAQSAKQTTNANRSKVNAARSIASSATANLDTKNNIDNKASNADNSLTTTDNQLSVISQLLADTADCNKLSK
jgi:hypothetical protein